MFEIWVIPYNIILDSAQYAIGEIGRDACPKGFTTITDPELCDVASKALGIIYSKQHNNHAAIHKKNPSAVCNCYGGCRPPNMRSRVHNHHGPSAKWVCAKGIRKSFPLILNSNILISYLYCTKYQI